MFAKIFALFAMLAVAFAAPNPKPQYVTYPSGLDYAYPSAGVYPSAYSPYASPIAYSGLPAYGAPYYYR